MPLFISPCLFPLTRPAEMRCTETLCHLHTLPRQCPRDVRRSLRPPTPRMHLRRNPRTPPAVPRAPQE
ncbi:hypothetical protein JB92DRAFT_3040264 [Gautieria morchelliformis]|nr:hypothetical protein JB92DRAFT_3040264 [Gautieria morchelliformis]